MKFELDTYHRNIADWQLIEDVIAAAKKMGKCTLTVTDYARHGKYHRSTFRKRFGSWFATLKKAGLEPVTAPRNAEEVNDEVLFKNLAVVWITLGRQPRRKDMRYPVSRFGYGAYVRYFGTWMNALRKFVAYKNIEPGCCDEPVNEAPTAPDAPVIGKECAKTGKPVARDKRHISLRLRFSVFWRDGFRCVACGRSPANEPGVRLHCDHIKPWSKGGETIFENLRTLCAECNLGKGDMMGMWECEN